MKMVASIIGRTNNRRIQEAYMGIIKKNFNRVMHEAQEAMLPHVQQIAEHNGVELDYTNGSIRNLDLIIPRVAEELHQIGVRSADEIELNESARGISESLGCYIVECIERNYGEGVWLDKNPETGDAAI